MRVLLLFLYLISTSHALVSIAPVDIGAKPGLSGNLSGSVSGKSGNTEKEEYALGGRLQYDEGSRYVVWGVLTYEYGTSEGVKNEDKTYAHLRYIRALYDGDWCGELFVQTEQDSFREINDRSLAGAGARWRFFDSQEWGRGYAGLGVFFEKVAYSHDTLNPDEHNRRLNSYIAYTKRFMAASKVSYIGYYQPRFGEYDDFVALQSLELIVPVYGKLSLSLAFTYDYDSRPPAGVEKRDTAYKTALFWEF
jgi:putative salt-induced outer membrane protein YdiY